MRFDGARVFVEYLSSAALALFRRARFGDLAACE
jgi:hypothetical protein